MLFLFLSFLPFLVIRWSNTHDHQEKKKNEYKKPTISKTLTSIWWRCHPNNWILEYGLISYIDVFFKNVFFFILNQARLRKKYWEFFVEFPDIVILKEN